MKLQRWSFAFAALALSAPPALAQSCGNSTGKTPINDLGTGTYQGFEGGLYPSGSNVPPPAHLTAALAQADRVRPLDVQGNFDPGCGLIGMISIGMSNTTHEYGLFEREADTDVARNSRVVIFNGAQGGQGGEILADPSAPYWTLVEERVAAVGLSDGQVQVAWLKEAFVNEPSGFPSGALALRDALGEIVRTLHDHFPNLRLCYLSSRTYGGYSSAHPEPVAYETGFAVQWLIEQQIGGDPALNWDPAAGAVEAPLLLWGPYLWADGQIPRSDGLTWCHADFESDGTHPSPSGEQKVASLLLGFFAGDPTAQAWYPGPGLVPLTSVDALADATVLSSAPNTNFGADTTLRVESQSQTARAYVRFDFSSVQRPVLHAKLSLRNPESNLGSGPIGVRVVADTSWSESAITFANAPPAMGALLTLPTTSRDGARSVEVTGWVNDDLDGVLSLVLLAPTTNTPAELVHSREGGFAPRLVLSLNPGAVTSYCTAGTTSNGCAAAMLASGEPSISRPAGFLLAAFGVEGQRSGLVFYGLSGAVANPWGASTLCVKAPVQRTTIASSGGTATACNGVIAIDWLDYLANHPAALGQPFASAQRVQAQSWFRDPPAPKTTNLSNALEFYTCP